MVAVAPIITDVPIVLVSTLILSRLSNQNIVLGIISLLGAAFILYLSYESITINGLEIDFSPDSSDSLKKGVITNALSPHPYIFWMTIGAPTLLKAYELNIQASILYVLGFYIFLVGSKVVIALITDKSKSFLKSTYYVYIIRVLGITLIVFAIMFMAEGLTLIGLI